MSRSMIGGLNSLILKFKTITVTSTLTKIHISTTLLRTRWTEKKIKRMNILIKMWIWMSSLILKRLGCNLIRRMNQPIMDKEEQGARTIKIHKIDNLRVTILRTHKLDCQVEMLLNSKVTLRKKVE